MSHRRRTISQHMEKKARDAGKAENCGGLKQVLIEEYRHPRASLKDQSRLTS